MKHPNVGGTVIDRIGLELTAGINQYQTKIQGKSGGNLDLDLAATSRLDVDEHSQLATSRTPMTLDERCVGMFYVCFVACGHTSVLRNVRGQRGILPSTESLPDVAVPLFATHLEETGREPLRFAGGLEIIKVENGVETDVVRLGQDPASFAGSLEAAVKPELATYSLDRSHGSVWSDEPPLEGADPVTYRIRNRFIPGVPRANVAFGLVIPEPHVDPSLFEIEPAAA